MSKPKKEDPRTIRSREMFKEAVFSLLSEGSAIPNLTVQKVAAKAGLNRTTFYLHYQEFSSKSITSIMDKSSVLSKGRFPNYFNASSRK